MCELAFWGDSPKSLAHFQGRGHTESRCLKCDCRQLVWSSALLVGEKLVVAENTRELCWREKEAADFNAFVPLQ